RAAKSKLSPAPTPVSSDPLAQLDEMQIVALGDAEAVVAVRERFALPGQCITAPHVPGEQVFADVDDRHPDHAPAALAHPLLRGGEQLAAEAHALLPP